MLKNPILAIALALLAPATALAGAPAEAPATRAFAAFVERLSADPSAPPGFAIAVTDGRRILYSRAAGVADAATGSPLTLDTPIYTGSTTKAYVGLLAARLDLEGSLPLGTPVTRIWPQLAAATSADFSKVTAANLLSHSWPAWDPGLNWLSNEAVPVGPDQIVSHLTAYARPVKATFHYSNLGPHIYSMMVQTRLRRDWRAELKRQVFAPLHLSHTGIDPETLQRLGVAHCNARIGGAWREVPPKPWPLLNAGGGVYASGNDAVRFIQAFMAPETAPAVPAAALRRTMARFSTQDADFFGFKRDGYGLGWDLSSYDGLRVVSRSGGYTGCRSMFAFLPGKSIGVTVLSVGDVGSNLFNVMLVQQAFDQWIRPQDAGARAATRLARFHEEAGAAIAEADRSPPPDLAALADLGPMRGFEGTYSDGGRLGEFRVSAGGAGLIAALGEFTVDLKQKSGDSFVGYARNDPAEPLNFSFERGPDGQVMTMKWDERVFRRGAPGARAVTPGSTPPSA
jgi:CubicO group peptidase (beta-lactamase class C family)